MSRAGAWAGGLFAACVLAVVVWYYAGDFVDRWVETRAAARVAVLSQKADEALAQAAEARERLVSAMAEVTATKALAAQRAKEVARLLGERTVLQAENERLRQSREDVHVAVAAVPDTEVVGRIRAGLVRLGLVGVGPGRPADSGRTARGP